MLLLCVHAACLVSVAVQHGVLGIDPERREDTARGTGSTEGKSHMCLIQQSRMLATDQNAVSRAV